MFRNLLGLFYFDADEGGSGATDTQLDKMGEGADTTQKFTQADIDRIVAERAKRAKDTATADLLKALGVEKIDDAAELIKAKRAADDAAKSELDKLTEAKATAERERDEARKQAQEIASAAQEDRRNSRIELAAKDAGAHYPADVIAWASLHQGEMLASVMNDKGEIQDKALTALIDKAKAERPNFFSTGAKKPITPGSPSNNNSKSPDPDKDAKERAKQNQAANIRRLF